MAVSILHGEATFTGEEDSDDQDLLLHSIFERRLKDDPSLADKCAVICGEKKLTFGQLNSLANRLARTLSSRILAQGKGKSERPKLIGVSLAPSEHLLATLLAILKCGGAYLPLDPTFPPARLQQIMTEAKPLLVIQDCPRPQCDVGEILKGITVNYEDLIHESLEFSTEDLDYKEGLVQLGKESHQTVCVLYTSGSSGIPKGVVLPHAVVLSRLRWQWKTFPFQDTEVCCFKTVLTFVDSVAEIFAPLLRGHTVVVIPLCIVHDPALLVAELQKHGIRRLVLVASLLQALLAFSRSQEKRCSIEPTSILPKLNIWINSGEVLTESLLRDFFRVFPTGRTLFNFYGSTEVMADVTYSAFSSIDDINELVINGKVPIGRPVDNTIIYVLDEAMQPVSVGDIGEVYVSGSNVAAGYLAQNGKREAPFVHNSVFADPGHSVLYKMGDFGRIVNGLLYYEGRTDSQIKVRGQRVDLTEIQRAARQIPGVAKAVVLCYQPNEPAQTIVLFYLPSQNDDGHLTTEAQLTSQLHHHLAPYMMPYVVKMDAIPLLINGKVDRQSLLRHFEEVTSSCGQISVDLSSVAEEELEVATALLTVTASVILNASQGRWCSRAAGQSNSLTVDTHFFSVGGNSLNALEVLAGLRDRGYHVSVADFLAAPTLRHVLHKINFDSEHLEINKGQLFNSNDIESKYSFLELKYVPKEVAILLTAQSFAYRAELENLLGVTVDESSVAIRAWWPALLEDELSFAVEDRFTKEIVAVSFNFDAHNEPPANAPPLTQSIYDFLDFLERPILLHSLPPGPGTVVHAALLATAQHVPPAENVRLVQIMEEHNIEITKQKGYKVIFTTNTSPVTKDICQELFGYQVFNAFQVNKYVNKEGRQIFSHAPDDYHVYVSAKFV